jgi:hypothetical protein
MEIAQTVESPVERRRSTRLASDKIDDLYECDAPRFFDFNDTAVENTTPQDLLLGDEWFSQKNQKTTTLDPAQIAVKKAKVVKKVGQVKQTYRQLNTRSCKPLTIPAEFNLSKPSIKTRGAVEVLKLYLYL